MYDYLELNIKNGRLTVVARFVSQRYLCRILQQPDDDVTPSVTTAINTDINNSRIKTAK